jgi:DHA1 family multidrug resistance protein-like MFS transporter
LIWVEKWKNSRFVSPFVLELLFIMFVVEFVKGALLLTILPVYMTTVLGASAYIIGWTLSVQYIGDNLLRTPVGWLIDTIGYRISMLSGVLLTFISVVLIATTSSYEWTILACALLGFGTAPLWPCVITGATEVAGDKAKGTIMSVVYVAWLLGVGLGPVVINFFIKDDDYSFSFRLLIGCMTAVVLVALMLPKRPKLRESAKEKGEQELWADAPANATTGAAGKDPGAAALNQSPLVPFQAKWQERAANYWRELKQSMSVSPLLFPAMFAQTFALGILTPILTLYAREVLHLSSYQYSLFLIIGGAITIIFLIPVGKWVDHAGVRWFLTIGFFISSATLIGFTYVQSLPILYGLVAALGLGYALIIPAWNALIASAIPKDKRGAVWGFFLTIEGLGMIVGPIVSGWLWDRYGAQVPFITSGVVLAVLLVLQWFISIDKKVVIR